MPKFNADDVSLFEPIEVTIEGTTYPVVTLTPVVMEKISKLFKEVDETEDMGKMFALASRQLGLFLDVPVDTFKDIDMRKVSAAVRYIINTTMEQSDVASESGKKQETGDKK